MQKIKTAVWFLMMLGMTPARPQDSLVVSAPPTYYAPVNILQFGDFLRQQGEYLRAAAEYQRYLFSGATGSRQQVSYQLGRCYLKASQAEKALIYFRQSAQETPANSLGDSAAVAMAAVLLAAERGAAFLRTLDSLQARPMPPAFQTQLIALRGLYYLHQQEWNEARAIFLNPAFNSGFENPVVPLLDLAERGERLPQKSRVVAGLMSTFLPGSGKIYAGRTTDGIYSFIVITGAAWLSYEGFRYHGASSYKGWLFGSVATAFHVGNIYGSIVAARFYNAHQKEQLARQVAAQLAVRLNF